MTSQQPDPIWVPTGRDIAAAGITDVLSKSLGSANPHNVVKATFTALAMLREPIAVAKQRNISLKKVFNG